MDSNIEITAEIFEKLKQLQSVPQENWYGGRREPCMIFIRHLLENSPNKIKQLTLPSESGGQLHLARIFLNGEEYIFFEEISLTEGQPVFEWFQLEKRVKNSIFGSYKTELLLASDDNAKRQGMWMLLLHDKFS